MGHTNCTSAPSILLVLLEPHCLYRKQSETIRHVSANRSIRMLTFNYPPYPIHAGKSSVSILFVCLFVVVVVVFFWGGGVETTNVTV